MAEDTRPESPDQSGVATQTAQPAADRKPAAQPPRVMPPWKVILHNDDKNDFAHVIKTIRRLTPLGEQEALLRMLEAHETGAALLLTTHRERAELYVDQFASCGLTVTAEPDA